MITLIGLLAFVIGAWVFSVFLGGRPSGKALSAMLIATMAFLFWWMPMAYFVPRGGIDLHPERDVLALRRFAFIGVVFAFASVILAARNPTKSVWMSNARVIGCGALLLSTMTMLFAAS